MAGRKIKTKSTNNNRVVSSAPSVFEVLLINFVVLKLVPGTDVNNWSWWWVLSPIWIPVIVVGVVFGVILLYKFIMNVGKPEDERV